MQDVYVGREAMVQVMLNFAGEAAEFRDKTAQYPELVHLVESRTHVADFLQNGAESNVCRGGINEGRINQGQPVSDKRPEVGSKFGGQTLGMPEKSNDSLWVTIKYFRIGRTQFVFPQIETVHYLHRSGPVSPQNARETQFRG